MTAVDHVLLALRAGRRDSYHADPDRAGCWHGFCPLCQRASDGPRHRLTITERRGGIAALQCAAGCAPSSIVSRLVLDERQFNASRRGEEFALSVAFLDDELAAGRDARQIIRVVRLDRERIAA